MLFKGNLSPFSQTAYGIFPSRLNGCGRGLICISASSRILGLKLGGADGGSIFGGGGGAGMLKSNSSTF